MTAILDETTRPPKGTIPYDLAKYVTSEADQFELLNAALLAAPWTSSPAIAVWARSRMQPD